EGSRIDHHTVMLASSFDTHIAVQYVGAHPLGIALMGRPVTAATRSKQYLHVSRFEPVVVALERQRLLRSLTLARLVDARDLCRKTTGKAPGRVKCSLVLRLI